MHRIDTSTAQVDKFGAGKNGFTRGNPQTGTLATELDDDYFDAVQEEICAVIEAAGVSLNKGNRSQLLAALQSLFLQPKNNFSEISQRGSDAVNAAHSNLGLGGAARLGVATSGQMAEGKSNSLLPTVEAVMSLFNKRNFLSNDYIRIPDVSGGLIIQWGTASVSQGSSMAVALPVSFSTACLSVMVSNAGNNTPIAFGAAGAPNKTYFNLYSAKATGAAADPGTTWNWLAIGF
ncbi:gp53-like domain-containing protein [Lonsdalea quercina]|uniref:gp53-like domain-containing protein n=1 Tax=Lonsdalea quercina TaxID=71657 RepID=UPI0039756D93